MNTTELPKRRATDHGGWLYVVVGLSIVGWLAIMSSIGCGYCLDPAHKEEARCKIQGAVVDCGAAEIIKAIPEVLAAVLAVISGSTIDWAALGRLEAAHGFAVIACAISRLDFMGQTPPPEMYSDAPVNMAARAHAGAIHNAAAEYMAKRQVHFK